MFVLKLLIYTNIYIYIYTYCLRGALPPVDLRAVCFVRAMFFCFLFYIIVCYVCYVYISTHTHTCISIYIYFKKYIYLCFSYSTYCYFVMTVNDCLHSFLTCILFERTLQLVVFESSSL